MYYCYVQMKNNTHRDIMALLGELGDVGVESLGQGFPDGVGVVDTRLHFDVVLPAQVNQLFSHLARRQTACVESGQSGAGKTPSGSWLGERP